MGLSFITDYTTPVTKAYIEQVVENWNSNSSNMPVKLDYLDHEELRDLLEPYLASDNPPDVLTWFAGNRMQSFIEGNMMMNTASIKGIEQLRDALQPRFQEMTINGDARFFIPTSYFWWGIYYRPSVFKRVGIDKPIKNWGELRVAVDKLRSAGIAPFALGSKYRCPATAWFDYLNMRINGPEFHQQLMNLEIPYTDHRIQSVLLFFKQLRDEGWFWGVPNTYDEEEAVNGVLDGKAGMTFIGSYVQDEYIPAECQEDLDFFRFPIIDERVLIGEDTPIDGFFAAGRSQSPEDAGDFLLYLGSQYAQTLATKYITALPTRKDIDLKALRSDLAKGFDIVSEADTLFQFLDLDTPWEIANVAMTMINDFASDETDAATVQQCAEEARMKYLDLKIKMETLI